ncbi:MAG: hypothetical protein FWH25_02180 [Syntrophorhabdaceae bacterium]|nr:hypothetical protein [Syntrophorhabdaceae bacterium]
MKNPGNPLRPLLWTKKVLTSVERYIPVGGAFTTGANKYIFESVANGIVAVIKNPANAIPK